MPRPQITIPIYRTMDNIQENMEDLVTHVIDYVDTQKELLVLDAEEKAAMAISSATSWLLFGVLLLFSFALLSVGFSIWLGFLFNNMMLGFLTIGGLYMVLATLTFAFRKSLIEHRLGYYLTAKFTKEDEQ